jgi:hypothetical protein
MGRDGALRCPRRACRVEALRACLKNQPKRRVRARGLQETAKISTPCRPGPLTGRFFKHALSEAWFSGAILSPTVLQVLVHFFDVHQIFFK